MLKGKGLYRAWARDYLVFLDHNLSGSALRGPKEAPVIKF